MKNTRKIIGVVMVLVLTLITLSGCVTADYGVKVNKDGSSDVEYIIKYNVRNLEKMGISKDVIQKSLESETKKLETKGYKTELISSEEIIGYKITKNYEDATKMNLVDMMNDYVKSSDNIKIENTTFTTKYSLDTQIDLTAMTTSDEQLMQYMNKSVDEVFDIKMKITLPTKPENSNATTIKGKTMEWDLKIGEVNKVSFDATGIRSLSVTGIFMLALLSTFIVVGILTLINSSFIKNKKTDNIVKVEDKEN